MPNPIIRRRISQPPPLPDRSAQFAAGTGLVLPGGLGIDPTQTFAVIWWAIQDSVPSNKAFMWGSLKDELAGAGDQIQCSTDIAAGGIYRTVAWASDGSNESTGDLGVVANTWAMFSCYYDPTTFPPHPFVGSRKNNLGFTFNNAANALMRAASGTNWYVGLGPSAGGWQQFPGRIDSMFVWMGGGAPFIAAFGALSDSMWNNGAGWNKPTDPGFPSLARANLWAAYAFDEPSGSTVWHDASGNAQHLTAVGSVASGAPRNF